MSGESWLSDHHGSRLEPLLPVDQSGAHRQDDRRVISGIVHMLRICGRWRNCPACKGPSPTIYNRYHRWSRHGIWQGRLQALVDATPGGSHLIERAIGRLKDRRRIDTRYDKLARNFESAVAIAAILQGW